MIVQAVFIYYGAAQIFNIQMGMWQSAFLIVSINTGAYMAESVRGGIISVDPGQTEGAKAIGMTHVQTMTNVILPQAFRNILPQIGNNLIINIKDTSVLSIISIVDLFFEMCIRDRPKNIIYLSSIEGGKKICYSTFMAITPCGSFSDGSWYLPD